MDREQFAALQTAKQGTIQTALIVVLIIAVALIERACPIPIPVPADQTQPKVEAKKDEQRQVEEPIKIELNPKVEGPVIGHPAVGH